MIPALRQQNRLRLEVLSHAQTSFSVMSWGGGGGGKKAVELSDAVSVAAMRMVHFMVVGWCALNALGGSLAAAVVRVSAG